MLACLVVFCYLLALSHGDIVQPSCSAANDVLDSLLNKSNTIMNESDSSTEPEDGFHLELPVSVLGFRLPWEVSFEVSDGSMKPFASLSRSSDVDAILCSTPVTRTLETQLKYDNIICSYKKMNAKFLFFEMEGSLLYNVGPVKFDVAIAKGTTLGAPQGPTCGVEAYKLVSFGTKGIEITSSSWASWLFRKLISSALLDENSVPLIDDLVHTSIKNIFTYFGEDWCETIWPDDI